MAAWYEPSGGANRAACVAQIVTDITAYLVTNPDGLQTFNIDQFMILAGTRLAAIPEPSDPFVYASPEALRGTDVRPYVETLRATVEEVQEENTGTSTIDLQPHLNELKAMSDAITAYYDKAYAEGLEDLLTKHLESGRIDLQIPEADDMTTETRYYRTTFVTDREEESAPSEVSVAVEHGTKDSVTITVGTVPSGRSISYWRVYRSNSGNETAAFQYVPNASNDLGVVVASLTFSDTVPNSELQEVCPSTIWAEPPATLQGLVGMANGINVGFFDNVLCPTPNYIPHAFPLEYRKTTEFPIVGLCAWGQTAFVGTKGRPYFLSGTDGATLSLLKLDSNQACVSPRSICATDMGVVYASPDGMCLATLGGVRLVSEGHWSREEWQALTPSSLVCQEHDGVLHMLFTTGPAMYTLDLKTGKLGTMSVGAATTLYLDAPNDTLFVAQGTTAVAVTGGTLRRTGTWKKRLVLTEYQKHARLAVDSTFTDANGASVTAAISLYKSDGTLIHTATVSTRDPVVLPDFEEDELIVKVESKAKITRVIMASSSEELARAG